MRNKGVRIQKKNRFILTPLFWLLTPQNGASQLCTTVALPLPK